MRVKLINVYATLLPVKGGTYRMASDAVRSLDSTLIEVVTDGGITGWGETCPIGPVYQPHHALGARAAIAEIAPGLIGEEVGSIRLLAKRMDERLNGHGYAKAAFDIAFLDILGQKLGVPVSTLRRRADGPRRDILFPDRRRAGRDRANRRREGQGGLPPAAGENRRPQP